MREYRRGKSRGTAITTRMESASAAATRLNVTAAMDALAANARYVNAGIPKTRQVLTRNLLPSVGSMRSTVLRRRTVRTRQRPPSMAGPNSIGTGCSGNHLWRSENRLSAPDILATRFPSEGSISRLAGTVESTMRHIRSGLASIRFAISMRYPANSSELALRSVSQM